MVEAQRQAEAGNAGAVAAMMALVMGMRACPTAALRSVSSQRRTGQTARR